MPTDVAAESRSVHHRNTSPVLLIGHGSSGTSVFADLCRKYLEVSFGTESQFIVRYFQRIDRYGDLATDENLRRLIGDLHKERWYERCRKYGYESDPERVFTKVRERTYRGVLDAVFGDLAQYNRMQRWGDKSPEYVENLPILFELFPDAKYIHLVRDGRDVANSVMGRYWGAKNVYSAAIEWRDAVQKVTHFVDRLPKGQVLEVRYEDFLTNPLEVYDRLINFLDVDPEDGALVQRIADQVEQDVVQSNFDKWKSAWNEEDRVLFERIACAELLRYGYETIVSQPDDHFSFARRAYWTIENRLLKWTYRDYWKDNLYKAHLRLRRLFDGGA